GTCSTSSPMLLAPSSRSFESLTVVMAMGTSCAFSARLRAVTTISSSPPLSALSCARACSHGSAAAQQAKRIFRVREPLSMNTPVYRAAPQQTLFAQGEMGYRSNERCQRLGNRRECQRPERTPARSVSILARTDADRVPGTGFGAPAGGFALRYGLVGRCA